MATEKHIPATYSDFAADTSHTLYSLKFRAAAARALLVQADKFDEADEEMVGLKYLLTELVREIGAIADLVGDSTTDYVAKAEMSHA